MPFTLALKKKRNILDINTTIFKIFEENCTILINKKKEELSKWRETSCSGIVRFNTAKIISSSQLDLPRFNAIAIKILHITLWIQTN